MQIVDLSYSITEDIISWPGYPQPSLKDVLSITKEGYRAGHISFMSHTGTHIDAPSHTLKGGLSLDELPISNYFGKAVLINLHNLERYIEIGDLLPHAEQIEKSKFVVLYCGHQHLWGKKDYFYHYPVLSKETTNWLCQFNLYGIGIDTFSVDPIDTKTSINHRILASKNMIVIENLANLHIVEELTTQSSGMFELSVFPIKFPTSDGAPVRAVGFIDFVAQ